MALLTELCPFVSGDATNMSALTGFSSASSQQFQINFAEAVVNHAGRGAAGGGNGVEALPPVFAVTKFHHAGGEQHAHLLAHIFARATGHGGALGDGHLPPVGKQLDDGPAHGTAEGKERGHGVELGQTGGHSGRVGRQIGTGIAHFLENLRKMTLPQAKCGKNFFGISSHYLIYRKTLFGI